MRLGVDPGRVDAADAASSRASGEPAEASAPQRGLG
jgi:hypothetical protein